MSLLVAFEMVTVDKRLGTALLVTFVRPLVSVDSPVLLQITLCCEGFPAIIFSTVECIA